MVRNPIFRRMLVLRLAVDLVRTFKRIERLQGRSTHDGTVAALYAHAGRRIRETASHLCGAIVKAGQFLSLREELLPNAFTQELSGLQDSVPAESFPSILRVIESEYQRPLNEVFLHIDEEPLAAASLAQVHRATLADGRTVAVKVLRPGMEATVRGDLAALRQLARVIARVPTLGRRMDFAALHAEFSRTLDKEMDLRSEANHLLRFKQAMGDDSRVVVPEVFEAYSTRRVLVMSYMRGFSVRDTHQLRACRVPRNALRDALLDVYLRQFFVTGFVHLDPHPGNVLVLSDGRLAMLDFGMFGEYGVEERESFRSLAQRAFFRDSAGVMEVLQRLGYIRLEADPKVVARDLDLMHADTRTLLNCFWNHESFQWNAKYMLLLRCVGLLKTVLTTLTPDETDWQSVLAERAVPLLTASDATSHR